MMLICVCDDGCAISAPSGRTRWTLTRLASCATELFFFSHQEKLAKSIHYLISKEDQVRTQITGLEQLISQTEVSQPTRAAAEPNLPSNNHRQALLTLTQPFQDSVYLELIVVFPFIILFRLHLVPDR